MHLRTRLTITLLLIAASALVAWGYFCRQALTRQWACYRVGKAETYEEARPQLAWFETGPDRPERLRDLVTKWGTGNASFDRHLAQYIQDAHSSEALRERFSLELAWRKPLLPRWAHYWAWRAPLEPEEQIASVVRYLDTIASVRPPKPLTWREVLDLQAIFELSGRREFAERLEPSNWFERYQRWRESSDGSLGRVSRPSSPFPGP